MTGYITDNNGEKMNNVHPLNPKAKTKSVSLTNYTSMKMYCPVRGDNTTCYFVPLSEICDMEHNPGRFSGTQTTNVQQLLDSMTTDSIGQKEPICLEWDKATGSFSKVFGFHRTWSTLEAYDKGFKINNHPDFGVDAVPGIWAWIFNGTPAEKTAIQMRENGNKTPHAPATKEEMVNLLIEYITLGGLDKGHKIPYHKLDDKKKYDRCRDFMKKNTPYWGGRKFRAIWNSLASSGSSAAAVNFTNYPKQKIAEYWCNNNPYGITYDELDKKLSGSLVVKNGTSYGIYFFASSAEMSAGLPSNATKMKNTRNADKIIVIGSLNNSTVGNVAKNRQDIVRQAKRWNQWTKKKTFDEMYFMPQTDNEKNKLLLSGGWALHENL